MAHRKEIPPLDLAAIELPSDQVTVGQMRRRQPDLFTQENFSRISGDDIGIVSAVCLEEMLAQKAHAAAASLSDPYPDNDRLEAITWLNDHYRDYGLSSGLKQTRELVRTFEAAAANQAKAAFGRSF